MRILGDLLNQRRRDVARGHIHLAASQHTCTTALSVLQQTSQTLGMTLVDDASQVRAVALLLRGHAITFGQHSLALLDQLVFDGLVHVNVVRRHADFPTSW